MWWRQRVSPLVARQTTMSWGPLKVKPLATVGGMQQEPPNAVF